VRSMSRGKQQILFNYLPGRTFDFDKFAFIARVNSIRGDSRTDLNASVLLSKIADEVISWDEAVRPALRNDILQQAGRFVLLDPKSVQAGFFPKVFWCQNKDCGHVRDFSSRSSPPNACPFCQQRTLVQLRFVRIHRCGALHPLLPPSCPSCRTSSAMCLDTRGSERISNFRWICRKCGKTQSLFAGFCPDCQWPDKTLRTMDIEVHAERRSSC
jgi:hypothetical protein